MSHLWCLNEVHAFFSIIDYCIIKRNNVSPKKILKDKEQYSNEIEGKNVILI